MHTVSLVNQDGSIEKFKLDHGEVVYDGLERQGKKLPHGCLAGSCGTCKVEVLEGSENLREMSAVEKDTTSHIYEKLDESYQDKTIRLSCRAKILGDITIRHMPEKL